MLSYLTLLGTIVLTKEQYFPFEQHFPLLTQLIQTVL